MNTTVPSPVRQRVVVALAPDDAFELFTRGVARWWPFGGHSCSGEAALDVVFEPRVGGAVTEIASGGAKHPWGRLTAWSPPDHFRMTWHPGQDPAAATVLSVRFAAVDGGCEVAIEHGGWEARGDRADEARAGYDEGWAFVLGRFAATVTGRAP
jgi:hypothetical protein